MHKKSQSEKPRLEIIYKVPEIIIATRYDNSRYIRVDDKWFRVGSSSMIAMDEDIAILMDEFLEMKESAS